jgi:hypothetical protein
MSTTKFDGCQRSSSLEIRGRGVSPQKEPFHPLLAYLSCRTQLNWVNRTFIARFRTNFNHRLTTTYWVQKTQNRKCSAIFKDGRRRHLENQCSTVSGLLSTDFDEIGYTYETCCYIKGQSRNFAAIFKMAAAVILKIDELFQFGPSSPDYEEIWYTD